MTYFAYKDGKLCAENVTFFEIAKRYKTPCYVYSKNAISSKYEEFASAFGSEKHLLCYAVKANSNISILKILARLGSGFDIVSGGELHRVIKAGGDPRKTVFSGVGKRVEEMEFALNNDIKCFNVESQSELYKLNETAKNIGKSAPVSLRVNPDVDAKTHPYISTGLKENKFGIAYEVAKSLYQEAAQMKNINLVGIDCHIGSQISDLRPFQDALKLLLDLIDDLKKAGIDLKHIDIGGGLGITYKDETPPTATEYVHAITNTVKQYNLEIIMEPGRSIVGNAGVLLTKVEYLNETPFRNFAIVDAAMNDLIRPSLYNSWHDIKNIEKGSKAKKVEYDIVGPVCETADFIGKKRSLCLSEGDLLAVFSVGAYGFSMASNYNSRPRPSEILVDNDQIQEIRKRESLDDLINGERLV
jgi:diaminopimelate decarboxylase|tara:strand:- start:135 stop:1379 length:1245 start_codon:yes stop_codon:yes gene_type:complete